MLYNSHKQHLCQYDQHLRDKLKWGNTDKYSVKIVGFLTKVYFKPKCAVFSI